MNIAQLSEQLKDVPDGTLAQYVRDPKSQVPQYLALGELQRRKRIREMGGVSPDAAQSRTLVDDILESGNVREAGLPGLPAANQMYNEQSFAGGGIIAFADGGYAEEDDDEVGYTQEDLDEMEMESQMESMLAKGMPRRGSIDGGIAAIPHGISEDSKAPRGIESLQEYVMRKESGGRRYDKEGKLLTSSKGAEGEMQVMPMTQRDPGFGVRPARDDSPEEKARVGRDYLSALYTRYRDPKIAAIAYNWGPGNTDKWLAAGADVDKLPRETRMYIAQMAGGGEVKHYATGDYVGFGEEAPYDPTAPSIFDTLGTMIGSPLERIKNQTIGKGFITNEQAKQAAKPKAAPKKDEAGLQEVIERAMIEGEGKKPAADVATAPAEKEMTPYDKAFARWEERRKALAGGAEQDKNLALLAAGLGMMGGKSQYALENIGAGGAQGLAHYAAAKRARAAEELAIDKAELGALKAKEYADIRKQNQEVIENSRLRDDLQQYQKMILGQINAKYKDSPLKATPEGQQKIEMEAQAVLARDPVYNELLRKAYPNLPAAGGRMGSSYSGFSGKQLNK